MEREILIIDDNLKLCRSLARSFAKRDITCYSATNSLDALPLFIDKKPGVVLLDIMLGSENGIEILKKFLELNPNVQVIMITAYAKIETAVEAIKIGAFDYIEKPVKFEKLLQVVKNAFKLLKLDEENQHFKARIINVTSNIVTQNETLLTSKVTTSNTNAVLTSQGRARCRAIFPIMRVVGPGWRNASSESPTQSMINTGYTTNISGIPPSVNPATRLSCEICEKEGIGLANSIKEIIAATSKSLTLNPI